MAFSINKATLVGNITSDITLKKTQSGKSVANFSVATNHSVKNGDEWDQVPTFHRIVAWGGVADFIEREGDKGAKVYIDGRIENGSYQKDDGTVVYTSNIVADNVILMSNPRVVDTSMPF